MQLRDYQLQAVADLRANWSRRPLLYAPVGSGKTVIMAEVVKCAVAKGRRVVFITHRRTLVYQTRDRFRQHGVECGVIMGKEDPGLGPVYVCSIQTLARRRVDADIAICDEAHHAVSPTWKRVLERYRIVLGCSATPYRLSGEALGDVFGVIVHGPSVSDLVANGILIAPRIFAPAPPDLKGVHVRGGDFVESELEEAMNKPRLVGDIVEHWKKLGGGRTVAFAVGIEHSRSIAAAFGEIGYHIDGSTPQPEREHVLTMLRDGRIKVLSSVDVIGEGFDMPEIDCAILARPTKSLALFRQQVGRAMRSCHAKSGATLLDHAGNVFAHGLPTDDVEVSLEGRAKRKQEAAPRSCSKCFAIIDSTPCWNCGFIPEPQPREIEKRDGELVELSGDQRREWYARQIAIASSRGYKIGFAKVKFKERFGVWPRYKEQDEAYVCSRNEPEQRSYGLICARCLRAPHPERDSGSDSERDAVVQEQRW